MRKKFTIFAITLSLGLAAVGLVYAVRAYATRDYYTVVDEGPLSGGVCLTIGPYCESRDMILKDRNGEAKTYWVYDAEVITTKGTVLDIYKIKKGTKVKIELDPDYYDGTYHYIDRLKYSDDEDRFKSERLPDRTYIGKFILKEWW